MKCNGVSCKNCTEKDEDGNCFEPGIPDLGNVVGYVAIAALVVVLIVGLIAC